MNTMALSLFPHHKQSAYSLAQYKFLPQVIYKGL